MKILAPNTNKVDVWNGYLRGGYATWNPGQDCEIHSHDDAAEIFVILSGEVEFIGENERLVVSAGQTVYVGPGEKHKLRVTSDVPMQMFLAVMPNHEPTHTFYAPDGSPIYRNRPAPAETD